MCEKTNKNFLHLNAWYCYWLFHTLRRFLNESIYSKLYCFHRFEEWPIKNWFRINIKLKFDLIAFVFLRFHKFYYSIAFFPSNFQLNDFFLIGFHILQLLNDGNWASSTLVHSQHSKRIQHFRTHSLNCYFLKEFIVICFLLLLYYQLFFSFSISFAFPVIISIAIYILCVECFLLSVYQFKFKHIIIVLSLR